ncbi:MAG: Glu-tRNA(Gln) amidotransferase subunit GatD [Candidatus Marsarchaeota archaeon]|nr:Glu-tRNA(Gln) amidotransferase subunit GatD [Candidatus Marsarchaeota archaeon]
MYSENLSSVFEDKEVAVGDTIKIETKEATYEGQLMPNTESNDPNAIIIKLKGGYNIGVLYGDKMKITKVEGRKKQTEFPFAKPEMTKGLPNVTLIWTGGTIGSKVGYDVGGTTTKVKPEELFYYIPELPKIANITIRHLFSVWSQDLTYMEWQKMASAVADEVNSGAHGVVVSHGTDTMHFTSAALSFMLKDINAPVVLTGAQRSSDRGSSDAFLNLIAAFDIAAKSDIAEVGICMHASGSDDKIQFLRGTKARKMHTSRRDAFRPVNEKPIAFVKNGEIIYANEYRKMSKTATTAKAITKFEPHIALVKVFPGSDPEIIEYYLEKGYRGIILEGTGLGHVPIDVEHEGHSWLPHIKNAIASEAVVGMTSQTLYGRVHENVYEPLRVLSDAGVIFCEDMLPETAYVKLGWLLGNHTVKEAKALLNKNIVGEIKERLTYDEFLI